MKFLRIKDVRDRIGYSESHIWRLARGSDFPKPIKLGKGASAWVEAEIEEWQKSRLTYR
jgi:prophage regulatory protein